MPENTPAADLNLTRQVFSGTVAKIVMALVGFAGSIFFARELGPALFGAVSLLFALAEWAAHPLYGVGAAVKKRVSESDSKRGALFGLLIAASAIWTFTIGAIAVGAGPWVRSLTSLEAAPVYLVGLVATTGMFTVFGMLVEGRGKVGAFLWTNAARKTSAIGLQSLFLYLGFGATGWVAGAMIASTLAITVLYILIGVFPSVPGRKQIRSVWVFARYSSVTSVLYAAYSRLDLLLIGSVIGTTTAGFYEIGWKITMFGVFIPNTIGNSLMSKVSAMAANGQRQDLIDQVESSTAFASVITIPLLFGSLAIGQPLIVEFYGAEYAPAADILVMLAVVRTIESQSDPIMAAIGGLDRPDIALRLTGGGIAVNVLLGVPLLYTIGPLALITVSAFAEFVRWSGGVYFLRWELGTFSPVGQQQVIQVLAATIMLLVVVVAQRVVGVESISTIGSVLLIGILAYSLLIFSMSSQIRQITQIISA